MNFEEPEFDNPFVNNWSISWGGVKTFLAGEGPHYYKFIPTINTKVGEYVNEMIFELTVKYPICSESNWEVKFN